MQVHGRRCRLERRRLHAVLGHGDKSGRHQTFPGGTPAANRPDSSRAAPQTMVKHPSGGSMASQAIQCLTVALAIFNPVFQEQGLGHFYTVAPTTPFAEHLVLVTFAWSSIHLVLVYWQSILFHMRRRLVVRVAIFFIRVLMADLKGRLTDVDVETQCGTYWNN